MRLYNHNIIHLHGYMLDKSVCGSALWHKNLLRYIVPERTRDILVYKTHLWILPVLLPFLVCQVQDGGEEW